MFAVPQSSMLRCIITKRGLMFSPSTVKHVMLSNSQQHLYEHTVIVSNPHEQRSAVPQSSILRYQTVNYDHKEMILSN